MTRTRPSLLFVLALAGAVAGWVLELTMVPVMLVAVV